ncbi:unnamed protein product [Closterium sp. Naga37s-1]|nr:unnamed protein product [Closterium sp. Naga37s-1]
MSSKVTQALLLLQKHGGRAGQSKGIQQMKGMGRSKGRKEEHGLSEELKSSLLSPYHIFAFRHSSSLAAQSRPRLVHGLPHPRVPRLLPCLHHPLLPFLHFLLSLVSLLSLPPLPPPPHLLLPFPFSAHLPCDLISPPSSMPLSSLPLPSLPHLSQSPRSLFRSLPISPTSATSCIHHTIPRPSLHLFGQSPSPTCPSSSTACIRMPPTMILMAPHVPPHVAPHMPPITPSSSSASPATRSSKLISSTPSFSAPTPSSPAFPTFSPSFPAACIPPLPPTAHISPHMPPATPISLSSSSASPATRSSKLIPSSSPTACIRVPPTTPLMPPHVPPTGPMPLTTTPMAPVAPHVPPTAPHVPPTAPHLSLKFLRQPCHQIIQTHLLRPFLPRPLPFFPVPPIPSPILLPPSPMSSSPSPSAPVHVRFGSSGGCSDGGRRVRLRKDFHHARLVHLLGMGHGGHGGGMGGAFACAKISIMLASSTCWEWAMGGMVEGWEGRLPAQRFPSCSPRPPVGNGPWGAWWRDGRGVCLRKDFHHARLVHLLGMGHGGHGGGMGGAFACAKISIMLASSTCWEWAMGGMVEGWEGRLPAQRFPSCSPRPPVGNGPWGAWWRDGRGVCLRKDFHHARLVHLLGMGHGGHGGGMGGAFACAKISIMLASSTCWEWAMGGMVEGWEGRLPAQRFPSCSPRPPVGNGPWGAWWRDGRGVCLRKDFHHARLVHLLGMGHGGHGGGMGGAFACAKISIMLASSTCWEWAMGGMVEGWKGRLPAQRFPSCSPHPPAHTRTRHGMAWGHGRGMQSTCSLSRMACFSAARPAYGVLMRYLSPPPPHDPNPPTSPPPWHPMLPRTTPPPPHAPPQPHLQHVQLVSNGLLQRRYRRHLLPQRPAMGGGGCAEVNGRSGGEWAKVNGRR